MTPTAQDQETRPKNPATVLSAKNQQNLLEMIQDLPIMEYRCLNDRNWTMQYASDACEGITGYKPAELVQNKKGQVTYLNLMHPDDRDRVWRRVQVALHKRASFSAQYRIVTQDNREKRVLSLGHGIFDPSGDLYAVEGFIIDLSEAGQA